MVVRRHVPGPLAWFVFAVAAAAAACGDLIVEMLADRGAFGAGRFSDGSTADVMPAAALGLLLLARFSYVRVRERLGDRASAALPPLAPRHAVRMLPPIFAVQIALLWAMETSEPAG